MQESIRVVVGVDGRQASQLNPLKWSPFLVGMEDKKQGLKCSTCQRAFKEGDDVYEVIAGIVGLRGIVPLEKPLLFCCAKCLKEYFSPSRGFYERPRRIP